MFSTPPILLAAVVVPALLFLLVLVSLGLGVLNFMLIQRLREEMRSKQPAAPTPVPAAPSAPAPQAVAKPAPAPTVAPAPVSAPAPSPELETPVIVMIAAAVHAALAGQPHRILRIEPVSSGWAREGRREIFSSRRVR